MENNNQWLAFLWTLHNKVRNAKGIKLTGISALNEISNFLLFFFMENKIVENKLPEYCKFSYLYEKYANKQAYIDDRKQPDLVKKNMYLLWHIVYDINNNDNCVIKCLLKNEFFKKYLNCMTHKPSAYALNNKAMQTIQECFTIIYEKLNGITWSHENYDMFGSAFEQFKEDAADKKVLGQHFTPPSIKNYIINEIKPSHKDKFYDPCSGSGGFVHTATSYVYKHDPSNYNKFKEHIYANECDPELIKTLMINMLLHDVPVTYIQEMDSLDYIENCKVYLHKFNKSATNPPFGMKITHEYVDINEFIDYWKPLIVSKKIIKDSTAQFILHIVNSLTEKDGHAGIVIDRGFLNNGCDNKNSWESNFRKYILEKYNLYKVVFLPTGIFTYTNFATAIIFIKTGEKTKQVDFHVGKFKDPNNKKSELITNDKPDLSVKIRDIEDNNWSLKYELDKPKDEVNENDKQESELWVNFGKIIIKYNGGEVIDKTYFDKGNKLLYSCSNILINTNYDKFPKEKLTKDNDILIPRNGSQLPFIKKPKENSLYTNVVSRIILDLDKVNLDYLIYYCNLTVYQFIIADANSIPSYNMDLWKSRKIPLLPLNHQQEIVEFLNKTFEENNLKIDDFVKQIGKTNVFKLLINKQYDEFEELVFLIKQKIIYNKLLKDIEKEKKIKFKQELEKVKTEKKRLGDLVEIKIGGTPSRKIQEYWKDGKNLWCKCKDLNKGIVNDTEEKITDMGVEKSNVKLIKKGSIMMVIKLSTMGLIGIAGNDMYCNEAIMFFKHDNKNTNMYLKYFLQNLNVKQFASGQISDGCLNTTSLKNLPINVPSLLDQEKIIQEIEKINDKQHHFQQHTKTIEIALEYALETVKNMCIKQEKKVTNIPIEADISILAQIDHSEIATKYNLSNGVVKSRSEEFDKLKKDNDDVSDDINDIYNIYGKYNTEQLLTELYVMENGDLPQKEEMEQYHSPSYVKENIKLKNNDDDLLDDKVVDKKKYKGKQVIIEH